MATTSTRVPDPTAAPALPWLRDLLTDLIDRRELSPAQMRVLMNALMTGQCGEVEAAAVLVALRMKGATAGEVAVAAEVMREHMVCWDPGRDDVLDTCGTGGDGLGTFNISTATALVAAAAGVPVVKHGNRSATSQSGSADVLRALGAGIDGDSHSARDCLERAGLAFCFAPLFHPAMRHVAAVRQRLRIPTLFNILGPLANPARSSYQLVGVGKIEFLDVMAGALARLGIRQALVVHGEDGLDEVTLTAPTLVRQVRGGEIKAWRWTAQDFGLAECTLDNLRAATPAESAALIRQVLRGANLPATRVVLANTAAALLAAEKVRTLLDGVAQAREALASGKAEQTLEKLIQATTHAGSHEPGAGARDVLL